MRMKVAILAIGLSLTVQTVHGQVVDIPDPVLTRIIQAELDKPTGDITVEDMESLTELDASCGARKAIFSLYWPPQIGNLHGLEAAPTTLMQ